MPDIMPETGQKEKPKSKQNVKDDEANRTYGGSQVNGAVQFTLITSTFPKILTKKAWLDENGVLMKESAVHLTAGSAKVVRIKNLVEFKQHLLSAQNNQAFLYGTPEKDEVGITTKSQWEAAGKPLEKVARTKEAFMFKNAGAVMMLDYDPDGDRVLTKDELVATLRSVSGFEKVAMLHWVSASSFLFRITGAQISGLKGQRLYVFVKDARDIPRTAKVIKDHMWAKGYGQIMISIDGRCLVRSVFDMCVHQPERIDFVAGMSCGDGVIQKRSAPEIIEGEYETLDTKALVPNDPDTHEKAQAAIADAKAAAEPKAQEQRVKYIKEKGDEQAIGKYGPNATEEQKTVERKVVRTCLEAGQLIGEFELIVNYKGKRTSVSVNELLKIPKKYDKMRTLDPFDHAYRNGEYCCILNTNQKRPVLYHNGHGGATYALKENMPLHNAEVIKNGECIFIHEDEAVADIAQSYRTDNHPWGEQLLKGGHVAWGGNDGGIDNLDWDALNEANISHAYIVTSNTADSVKIVPKIAERLHVSTSMIQFTDEFPIEFNLAQPFPKNLFNNNETSGIYCGPDFYDCAEPATWATDRISTGGRGAPPTTLRDSFKGTWTYVRKTELFVFNDKPWQQFRKTPFDAAMAPFSHTKKTSDLVIKSLSDHVHSMCYRPDKRERFIANEGERAINLYVSPNVGQLAGDLGPWIEFLQYLVPNADDRKQVERWVATLIARPDIRMMYAMLLFSEMQGTGKTTLAESVLAPLVGKRNVSHPTETDLVKQFNGWIGCKRLVIVAEIYQGHGWKMANMIKSLITDPIVRFDEKNMVPYDIDNWAHFLASSNSPNALRMEDDERRWLVPEITETPWSREKFVKLRKWLDAGGLETINHWAHNYEDYVLPGEIAPMTAPKRRMIEDSRSQEQHLAQGLARLMQANRDAIAFTDADIHLWVKLAMEEKRRIMYDSKSKLCKAMKAVGCHVHPERIKYEQKMVKVVLSSAATDVLNKIPAADKQGRNAYVRSVIHRNIGFSANDVNPM